MVGLMKLCVLPVITNRSSLLCFLFHHTYPPECESLKAPNGMLVEWPAVFNLLQVLMH